MLKLNRIVIAQIIARLVAISLIIASCQSSKAQAPLPVIITVLDTNFLVGDTVTAVVDIGTVPLPGVDVNDVSFTWSPPQGAFDFTQAKAIKDSSWLVGDDLGRVTLSLPSGIGGLIMHLYTADGSGRSGYGNSLKVGGIVILDTDLLKTSHVISDVSVAHAMEGEVLVSPNPAATSTVISKLESEASCPVSLFSTKGVRYDRQAVFGRVDVEDLPRGVYALRFLHHQVACCCKVVLH